MLENCSKITDCEKELVSKTREHHLIGETVMTPEDVELLGSLIKKYLDLGDLDNLKYTAPACLSYFLVWKGVLEYDASEGNFWSSVEYSLGEIDPNIKKRLGEIFFRYSKDNNLPLLELRGANKYVTNILIHGTIPDSNLDEYFEKVIAHKKWDIPVTDIEGVEFFIANQRDYENKLVFLEDRVHTLDDEIENLKNNFNHIQNVVKLWEISEQIENLEYSILEIEHLEPSYDFLEQKNELVSDIKGLQREIDCLNNELLHLQEEVELITFDPTILLYSELLNQIRPVLKHKLEIDGKLKETEYKLLPLAEDISNLLTTLSEPLMDIFSQNKDITSKLNQIESDYLSCYRLYTSINHLSEEENTSISKIKTIANTFGIDINPDIKIIIDELENLINYTELQKIEKNYLHTKIDRLSSLKDTYFNEKTSLTRELGIVEQYIDEEIKEKSKNLHSLVSEKERLERLKNQFLDTLPDRYVAEEILILKRQRTSRECYTEELNKLETEIQNKKHSLQNHYIEQNQLVKPFQYINEPIRRFLLYGGKLADKFLYQSFKMLEFAQENKIIDYRYNIDLPDRIVDRFIQWWNSYESLTENVNTEFFSKKGRFYQPIIKFDYKEDITALLPVQKINSTGNVEGIVLAVNMGKTDHQKLNIPAYSSNAHIETEETEFRILSPAKSYLFQLSNGSEILHSWFIEDNFGIDSLVLAFDHESKKLIDKEQLPKDRLLIVSEDKYILKPETSIFEEGELYGKWGDFRYWAVDLRDGIESLWLEDREGHCKYLPLSEKRSLKPTLLGGELLENCNHAEQTVYCGEPPSISLNLDNIDDINNWNIYIYYKNKSTLKKPLYSKLNRFQKILQFDETNLKCMIPLSHDSFLGEKPVGNFTVRLKNNLEDMDQEFSFLVLPSLTIDFDKDIYLPHEKEGTSDICIKLNYTAGVIFEPKETVIIECNESCCYCLKTDKSQKNVKGTLKYPIGMNDFIEMQLDILIPKLTWRIEGLKNEKFQSEFCEVIEIEEDHLNDRLGDELLLTITIPSKVTGKCRLELNGTDQFDEVTLKNGIAKFSLLKFMSTIKSNRNSSLYFELSTRGQGIQIENALLFSVQKWKVKNISHKVSRNEGNRIFDISWEEDGDSENKAITLWKLTENGGKLIVENPIQNVLNLQFQVPENEVEMGRYLIHFTKKDDWKQLSFPGENSPNSKEILIDIDDDAPLILANEKFDREQYLQGILILRSSYKNNNFLRSAWLHKINHGLIINHKLSEASGIFKHLLLSERDFTDTDSFTILTRLLTVSNQNTEFLDETAVMNLLEAVVHILIENSIDKKKYRNSSMVIKDKKINSKIFEPIKLISPEVGKELESILKNSCNGTSHSTKLRRAKDILDSIKGV